MQWFAIGRASNSVANAEHSTHVGPWATGRRATAMLAAAIVGTSCSPSSTETLLDNWSNPIVSADERSITVSFVIGSCGKYSSEVRVSEDPEKVELTVVTTAQDDCNGVALGTTITAQLETPLGERDLYDGHCVHLDWGTDYACPPDRRGGDDDGELELDR